MEKENKQPTYDEAIARIEALVGQLERSEALSMDEYKRIATEAKTLLEYCRQQVEKMDKELKGAE